MIITRRSKYSGHGRTAVTNNKLKNSLNINLDISFLRSILNLVTSQNSNIRRMQLINIRNLFQILDRSQYLSDIEKTRIINYIEKGIDCRLNMNLTNKAMIIQYINNGLLPEDQLDPNTITELSNSEITFIDSYISEALKYSFINDDVDKALDVFTRFKSTTYGSRAAIVDEIEQLVNDMQTKFRRVKAQSSTEMMFSLQNGTYEDVISEVFTKLKDPSRYLYTGMQGFNELLGGAAQSERVYMLLGNTGAGKSLFLLNLALQMKKYNKNYKCKDPTKRPCIVYLTMENSVAETIERLFEITVNKGEMKSYENPQQIMDLLINEGELSLTDDSPIDIIIKYQPNKSVDTSYLYQLTEDLEDEGYEVICLIQDHIKRIISSERNPDIRLELGAIVNDFKTFATLKDLVVITNSHLNREGNRIVEEGMRNNKADIIRQLGRANIGESMLMLDNLDGAFIIGPQYDSQGNKYMAIQRIKERYKCTDRAYICQPFVQGSNVKLMEDMDLAVPVFKDTMRDAPPQSYTNPIGGNRQIYNNIRNLDEEVDEVSIPAINEELNLFNGKMYFEDLILDNDEYEDEPVQTLVPPPDILPTTLVQPFIFVNR